MECMWRGMDCRGDGMKEVTRITTVQITQIMQDSEKGADYMKVANVQVFVREGKI